MAFVDQKPATVPAFTPQHVETLAARFAGALIQPGDPRYDETRQVWNGMIDKQPALIARCSGVSDVIQAVSFAREHGLHPAIRGGGHNVAGHAVSDGGLMIDLSLMRSVHVNPAERTARAEAGATWADFDRETAVFGLATTGGVVSSTGVAGLTLGGGIGWLVGKYGLSIDNLLAVELVSADGTFLRASADENPDLFWALRGGGGNFGVATAFEFKLHPVAEVFAGVLAWPASEARDVAEFYRRFTQTNPDEMTMSLQFFREPESGARMIALGIFYPDDMAQGERLAEEIRQFKTPVFEMVGPMPYHDAQRMVDPEFPHGARYYWKGVLLKDIHQDVIDALVEQGTYPEVDTNMLVVEHYRGAMNRVDAQATAFPHREAHYQVVIIGRWFDPADDEQAIAWARRLNASVEPHSTRARFLNFSSIDRSERENVVRASFGPNYDRLVDVKRSYDPHNLFRENNNISPD